MKSLIIILLSTAVVVGAFFLLKPTPAKNPTTLPPPWNIAIHDNGTSTVFDITLEQTTFLQAAEQLGIDREIAVLIDNNDIASLEMYYSHFRSGALAGKLIISSDASSSLAAQLAGESLNAEYLGTGSRRFDLALQQLTDHPDLVVTGVTLIPSINLDQGIIEGRFGAPDQLLTIGESQHFLYPTKGLDIVLNKAGKETLQYVAPRNFESLRQPLLPFVQQPTKK